MYYNGGYDVYCVYDSYKKMYNPLGENNMVYVKFSEECCYFCVNVVR